MIHQHFIYIQLRSSRSSAVYLLPVTISILEQNFMWFMSHMSVLLPRLSHLLASRMSELEMLPTDVVQPFRFSHTMHKNMRVETDDVEEFTNSETHESDSDRTSSDGNRVDLQGFTVTGTKCSNSMFKRIVTFGTSNIQQEAQAPLTASFMLKVWLFPIDPANPYAALPIDA